MKKKGKQKTKRVRKEFRGGQDSNLGLQCAGNTASLALKPLSYLPILIVLRYVEVIRLLLNMFVSAR